MSTHTLTIAILGAGNIGGTLGKKWHAAGHQVAFGVNNPESPKVQAVRSDLGDTVVISSIADVLAKNPDVVVLAIPGKAVDEVLATYAAQLDKRIIIDATNRVGETTMHSLEVFEKHAPQAQVFRAFNTLGWENFADPYFDGIQADLFYCGPEGEARSTVEGLIGDVGLRGVYLGGPDKVGLVDAAAGLWFALVFGQGKSRHLAFKVLER
ncbi:NADPH-dependent F420 reductase [Ktedonobacter robiniae]|uniref:Pyrroline-5-carboxylate reductase catalytic N-terminal domain-containing protein n=1 Tax=Ktedonobacter robiniae TaxID=2778365 RepID=A0ABQ3UFY3_9CHLR|nr:NAD(P)-binding domain-containing protein [Ktedonobacter robiniae]GHO51617.1 hypothetical protein KSB_00920 [Ktedonobacter robiniae]